MSSRAAADLPLRRWLRSRTARALRIVALVVAATFALWFVAENWTAIVTSLARLDGAAVGGALVAILAGLTGAMLTWRALLAGFGFRLPVLAAARVFFIGQLGKYIPGSIWPIVAQADLSRRYGVPAATAGLAALVQMLVGVVVGVVVAGTCLALSANETLHLYLWLAPVAVVGAVTLTPSVFSRLVAVASRLTRNATPPDRISGGLILTATAWSLTMWVAFGAHLWLLALGWGAESPRLFLISTGAYALAWVVGFLIVLLPAGAGAREAALVIALSPSIDRNGALALALVSRFLMLLGDGLAAAYAAVTTRQRPAPDADNAK